MAVILLSVFGGIAVLCGGGGAVAYFAGVGAASPEEVVEDYFAALQRGDCDAMVSLVTEESWREGGATSESEAVSNCEQSVGETDQTSTIELEDAWLVSESGDTAVVRATVLPPLVPGFDDLSEPIDVDFTLRREGRDWKVDGSGESDGLGVTEPELPELDEPGGGLDLDPPPLEGDGTGTTEAPAAATI